MAALEQILRKLEDDYEDVDFETAVILDRNVALERARQRRMYIENVYPEALTLFEDWLRYLEKEVSVDNLIYIELLELAGFYARVEDFTAELDDLLTAFDTGTGAIRGFEASLVCDMTGFEGWNEERFMEISSAYRARVKK